MTCGQPGTSRYQPISCARYEEYEMAILQRRPLRLAWSDDGGTHEQVVTPLDLRTENGTEYLIVRVDSGDPRKLRLDCIARMQPV